MADDLADDSTVLSDVDDDGASPSPIATTSSSSTSDQYEQRIRDLLSDLAAERRSRQETEDALKRRDESINRLRAFAQDVIKKRDDAVRDKDDALAKLADAIKQKDEVLSQMKEISRDKKNLKSEIELVAQMMATGIDKISAKVSSFKNFGAAGGLPRSQKYATGMPSVAYGVIKRANEIAEELMKQIDSAAKLRDQAREQVEQRNYEIAIEVSQLEAAISGLREESLKKGAEIERLEGLVEERNAKISEMEKVGKERDGRIIEMEKVDEERDLEVKMDLMRKVVVDQLSNVSKAYEQIHEIVRVVDGGAIDLSWDTSLVWEEMDLNENLRALSEGTVSVYEMAKVAMEKVRAGMEDKRREIDGLKEKVDGLLGEKQHIGTLLRSALQSKTNGVLQVAKDGLREVGIDLRVDERGKRGVPDSEEDEVYYLVLSLHWIIYHHNFSFFGSKGVLKVLYEHGVM